ncbi:MAG: polysaccharide biosynthesis tyrosine autokinase, partial [Stenotrophobium sp.]
AAICLAGLYLWIKAPVYEANATVQVETKKNSIDAAIGNMANDLLGDSKPESAAEMEIIKSRMVVGKVIDTLNLEISAKPHYFPIIGAAVARHRGALNAPASAFLGLNSFAWGGEKIVVTSLDVPAAELGKDLTLVTLGGDQYRLLDSDDAQVLTGKASKKATGTGPYGQYAIFVRELTARAGTRFDVRRLPLLTVYKTLAKQISVAEQGKQTGIIGVSYDGTDRQLITDVVNQLVIDYQKQNVERRSAEAQQTLDFLQQQLPKLREQVETSEAQLNKYRLKEGSADLTQETQLVLQQSVDLEGKRLDLTQKRAEAIRRFTPDHPVIQGIDAQIKQIQSAEDQIAAKVKALPDTQQELLKLSRDVEVNTQLYTTLLNSAQGLQISRAGTIGNVRIIDSALPPLKPVQPVVPLVLALGLMLGVFLGIAASFLRRALHSGVDDPQVVEQRLAIATYASIPYSNDQRSIFRRFSGDSSLQPKDRLLAAAKPHDVATEAFRSLRTSLHFALLESRNNVIMLTGPSPSLGKSFMTANLGYVLAVSGKRVVIVDADLRRGHLHDYFGIGRVPGVTDYVAGNADYASIIRHSTFENLSFVSTGRIPPNPAELVLHEKFTGLIERLSQEYDHVLVDTPPVLAVTDGAVIGQLAGCTLLVLKSGEHSLHEIEETARRLRSAGVQVRGTLFNQVGLRPGYYGYKYSYAYAYKPLES